MKSSLVEMIMVMTLLVLVGTTIFTLIHSGAGAQARINQIKDAQVGARTALSHINIRLRQNDVSGKIAVEPLLLTGKQALVIRERTPEQAYDTWIFWYGGKIYECLTEPDVQPGEPDSTYIAATAGLEIACNIVEGTITSTIYYYYGDDLLKIASTVYLRSYAGA